MRIRSLRSLIIIFSLLCYAVANAQSNKWYPVLKEGVPVMDSIKTATPLSGVVLKKQDAANKTNNLCGVTASFVPGVDTFFAANTSITFTSTSINATSVQWILNGNAFFWNTNSTFNNYFEPGVNTLSLVAINGSCTDTMTITVVCTGFPPSDKNYYSGILGLRNYDEKITAMAACKDSGFLLAGTTTYQPVINGTMNGLLIKLRNGGCIEWSKLLKAGNGIININQVCGLRDSGFLISAGYNLECLLLRIDKWGNEIWAKRFNHSTYSLGFTRLYEMSDGTLIVTTSPFSSGFHILKLDASGNMIWNKNLVKQTTPGDLSISNFIYEWKSHLYVGGTFKIADTSFIYTNPYNSFVVKLDPANGQLQWTKMYQDSVSRSTAMQDMQAYDANTLFVSSLQYNTLGGYGVYPSLIWLDSSGNITQSRAVRQYQYQFNFPTGARAGVLPGGNVLLFFKGQQPITLQPGFINKYHFFKLRDTGIIWHQMNQGGITEQYSFHAFNGKAFAHGGHSINTLMNYPQLGYYSYNLNFVRRDSAFTYTSWCGYLEPIFSIRPFTLNVFPVQWIKDTSLQISINNVAVTLADVYPQIKSICPLYVDSCAVLEVQGPVNACNLSAIYTYKAGRNNKCGLPVQWFYQGPLTVLAQSDSSITVQFNATGTAKIGAKLLNTCNPVADSVVILVGPPNVNLNLGPDSSICPGNIIKLHASPHFLSYQWQNSSTDSTFDVSSPGLYWVKTVDSCGNIHRDSINVTVASSVPIDIGPERIKCNKDTIHLQAPPGFLNYTWSNNYNINVLTGPSVIVNPLMDTSYYIKAEKTPGCYAFDTVRIKVYQSGPVGLGNDTSFCVGGSAGFTAAGGFVQYLWNTGSVSQQIVVSAPGSYSVVATTSEGCKSYDTARILNVWPLPVVNISGQSSICEGAATQLDAGNSTGNLFQWNVGATGSVITVTSPGEYIVTVTDSKGCKDQDTFRVTNMLPLPSDFLGADTSICSYRKLTLSPLNAYSTYLWSTNATSPAITVTQPGIYWLQVKDANNCTGRDSIMVVSEDCMYGFYVPNAFTPDGDRHNDLFRPLLFGDIREYRFSIYDRWGGLIFQTTDPNKGWDGTLRGKQLASAVFVWTCTYRLDGGNSKNEKGTVLLIR